MTQPAVTHRMATDPSEHARRLLIGRYTGPDGAAGIQRVRVAGDRPVVEADVALESPSWMERIDGWVLAVTEAASSRLSVVRDDASGLEVTSSVETGGADACHLAVSPDRRHVAVAHYTSGSVRLLDTPRDGSLAGCLRDLLQLEGHGPDPDRQEAPHAHQVTWLDNDTMLVCDLGTDTIRVVEVEPGGSLQLRDPIRLPAGTGPRHLVLRGDRLAVVGELSGQLLSLRLEGDHWRLVDQVPTTHTSAGGREGRSQPSALVSAGNDLVVGNRLVDSVARFAWTPDARLRVVAERSCPAMPRDVAVLGDRVLVAGQEAGLVTSGSLVAATDPEGAWDWTLQVPGAARILV